MSAVINSTAIIITIEDCSRLCDANIAIILVIIIN